MTLSTTGYGDIAPVEPHARLINAFVVTPLRIAFLVLLIGTTLEVLASQGREMFRVARWRKKMGNHVVVVGYGTKGRSAVETLINNGQDPEAIVVVDTSAVALADAHADGLAVVTGDATRRGVLRQARVFQASQVIITTDRDDSNVLATLTVRQLNPDAYIVSAVREHENAPLMRQSGANSVITSSDAVGRLLGLSSLSPTLGSVMEDLLTYGEGLEVAERDLLVSEVGQQPQGAARPGDRGRPRREGLPLLRPGGHPARPRRPPDRRPAGEGAALGAPARHPQRGHRQRRGLVQSGAAGPSSKFTLPTRAETLGEMSQPPAPRVRRHLMDPANPRRSPQRSMSVSQVQKWVLSALAVTTILHLSAGLILAAIFLDDARGDAGKIALNVIAGLIGVGAVAAARGIHQKPLLSPWLAVGFVPCLVGLYLTF